LSVQDPIERKGLRRLAAKPHTTREASLPQPAENDDRTLERYVLGLLTPNEAIRLDRASIEDDEVAARLRIVEQDLVDRFVRRALDAELVPHFEACYLASLRRRRRVRFAETFLEAVDRAAVRSDAETSAHKTLRIIRKPEQVLTPAIRAPRSGRLAWTLSLAAAVVLTVCATWLIERPSDSHLSEPAAAPEPVPPARGHYAERRGMAEASPVGIVLVLPVPTRAGGPVPTITLAGDETAVGLALQTGSTDFVRYCTVLKDPSTNRPLWRSGWINASDSNPRSVEVAVPATLLNPQRYWLDLGGRRADGGFEIIGSYVFHIVRP
jgi:hypothetical protein